MSKNLLIIGANILGITAKEIAEEMACFDKVDFSDDEESAPDGTSVVCKICEIDNLVCEYKYIFVALDDNEERLKHITRIEEESSFKMVALVSPRACVSSSAQVFQGSIVEPLASVGAGAIVSKGCVISQVQFWVLARCAETEFISEATRR